VNRDKTYVCVHMQTWMKRTGAVAGAGPIWSTARVRSPHALPSQLVVVLLMHVSRDENGTDIFRPYSIPNPFRGVLIRPYPSPDI
jgi:hypothetical protein